MDENYTLILDAQGAQRQPQRLLPVVPLHLVQVQLQLLHLLLQARLLGSVIQCQGTRV